MEECFSLYLCVRVLNYNVVLVFGWRTNSKLLIWHGWLELSDGCSRMSIKLLTLYGFLKLTVVARIWTSRGKDCIVILSSLFAVKLSQNKHIATLLSFALWSWLLAWRVTCAVFCTGSRDVGFLNVRLNQYQRSGGKRLICPVDPSIIWSSCYLILAELLLIGCSLEAFISLWHVFVGYEFFESQSTVVLL